MRKPDTRTAIANLIREARDRLPFDLSFAGNCEGRCDECPFKLLEFLDMALSHWETRLERGDLPTLGDVHTLGRECQEVHAILSAQNLVRS